MPFVPINNKSSFVPIGQPRPTEEQLAENEEPLGLNQQVTMQETSAAATGAAKQMGEIRAPRPSDTSVSLKEPALAVAETLPMAGQIAGGIAGEAIPIPGLSIPLAAGGAAAGELLKQKIQQSLGTREDFELDKVKNEAALTAFMESVTRIPAHMFFKHFRMVEKMGEVGKKLGRYAQNVEASGISIKKKELFDALDRTFKDTKLQSGPIKGWINLVKKSFENIDDIGFIDIRELRQTLGNAIKTASGYVDATGKLVKVKNTRFESAAKEFGGLLQQVERKIAAKSGNAEYLSTIDEFAKLASDLGETGSKLKDTLGSTAAKGVIGTMVGIGTGNPMAGAITTGAALELTNPTIMKSLYKFFEKKGVGRTLTVAASELLRKMGATK